MMHDQLRTAARIAHLEPLPELLADCEEILKHFTVLQDLEPGQLRRITCTAEDLDDTSETTTQSTPFKAPRTFQ